MKTKSFILTIIIALYSFTVLSQNLLSEGFEGTFPPTNWTILNLGDQTDGETWIQSSTHHHTGSYSAFSQDGATSYAMEEWLITPAIAVSANNYIELTFWHKFQWASYSDGPEYVMISTSGIATENFTDTIYTLSEVGPTGWTEIILNDLPNYAGQTIYIAFVHTSANGMADAWNLDDISVDAFETSDTDVGILSISIPTKYSEINTEIFPSGTIKNYGTSSITDDFQIFCDIVNSSSDTVYSDTITYTAEITSEQTVQITFTDAWLPTETGDYTAKMKTVLTGDISVNNDTLSVETEVVQHEGTGGPDAFGYQWIDSKVEGGPVYDWIEISETGESAIMYEPGVTFYGDDNFSSLIPFEFSFPFYGIMRDSFYVDINGEILLAENTWYNHYPNTGWGTDGNMFNYIMPIPGNTTMPALVSVLWDDLRADEGVGDIYFQTFGDEPNRYCVVEWHNLRYNYGTVEDTTLCFEVIFHENGDMIFQYKNVDLGHTGSVCPHDYGQSSTIGIQNDSKDIGLSYLFEIVEDNQYIGVEPVGNILSKDLAIKFYTGIDDQPPFFVYEGKGNTFDNTIEFEITISDMSGLLYDSLYYDTGSGWQSVSRSSFEEPNIYHYVLADIPDHTALKYYFAAIDNSDLTNRGTSPANAPEEYYSLNILPTSNNVKVLLVYSGTQDYNDIEFNKFKTVFDNNGISYDIYDWEEYESYRFTDNYEAIFMYGTSIGHSVEEDSLALALIEFLDLGTNENPKNLFTASDEIAGSAHPLPNNRPLAKFYYAYIRGGYIAQVNPPSYGGTDGIGGPDIYEHSEGSIIGMSGSPIGENGIELPVYSNSPDVIYNRTCPEWYAEEVTNPDISSWGAYLFEDGPHDGNAYSKGNGCGIWLDNLIYKSFFISFDISQFTNDDDIDMLITDALNWFGIVIIHIDLGEDQTACEGDIIILDAGEGYDTYLWNDSTTNQTLEVTESGTYSVTVTNNSGSSGTDEINITFYEYPVVDLITNDTTLCANEVITIIAGTSENTYIWSDTIDGSNVLSSDTSFTFDYSVGSGKYYVLVTNSGNCTTTDSVQITFNSLPEVEIGPTDTIICDYDSLILIGGTLENTYIWKEISSTDTISQDTSFIVNNIIGNGTYYVIATNSNGCYFSDTIQISFQQAPIVNDIPNDTAVCEDISITLIAGTNNYSYNWTSGSSPTLISTDTALVIDYLLGADTYYFTATDTIGCVSADSTTVGFYSLPDIDLVNDTSICEDENLILSLNNDNYEFVWSNYNDASDTLSLDSTITLNSDNGSGYYYVFVTNENNCSISDSVNVTFNPIPYINLGDDTTMCEDETIELIAGTTDNNYIWTKTGLSDTLSINNTLTVDYTLGSGNYIVEAINIYNCSNTDNIQITFNPLPVVDLGIDTTVAEATITLNAGEGYATYIWSKDNVIISGETSNELIVNETATYMVTVTDANGCEGFDEIVITFITDINDITGLNTRVNIYPNPNQGLFNLEIFSNNNTDFAIEIINVQGQVVYSKNILNVSEYSENIDISGFSKGFYYLKVNTGNEVKTRKLIFE
ncbi:MAG: choice-of-anchor J domain-containing protein [Bacteroidales bacterium]|nr:choice-of-anchor J domain-containing protein [Bacteroidales bacterium]